MYDWGMRSLSYAPPGWPIEVRPPGVPDWEISASAWLLDLCPPEYRGYPVLRKHVLVLARFAAVHVEACQESVRRGIGQVRDELKGYVPAEVLSATLLAWQREEARLISRRREVGLVEDALRGRTFVPRL